MPRPPRKHVFKIDLLFWPPLLRRRTRAFAMGLALERWVRAEIERRGGGTHLTASARRISGATRFTLAGAHLDLAYMRCYADGVTVGRKRPTRVYLCEDALKTVFRKVPLNIYVRID